MDRIAVKLYSNQIAVITSVITVFFAGCILACFINNEILNHN